MTDLPKTGKQLPAGEDVVEIAKHIFMSGIDCFTYTLKQPNLKIHYIAQHKNVLSLLKGANRKNIDLSQYNHQVSTCTDHTGFLLGDNDKDTKIRWEILEKSMLASPKLDRRSQKLFADIGKKNTRKVTNFLLMRSNSPGEFNAVREYGYLIGYLSAVDFFGLAPPQKPSFILKLIIFTRNILLPGSIRLKGDMVGASAFLLWSQFMAPHLFANLGNRNKKFRKLAKWAAAKFEAQIKCSLTDTHNPPYGSLIHRLKAVQGEFKDINNVDYEKLITSILLEMIGEVVFLPGQAFANVLKQANQLGVSPKDFLDLIDAHGNIVIDEMLRLDPTTGMVFRVVKQPFIIGETKLNPGDGVCLLLAAAGGDPSVFENPKEFAFTHDVPMKRDWQDYINFGANEPLASPHPFRTGDDYHPCFGQYWSRELIKAMFEGLLRFPDLKFPKREKS